MTLSSLVNQVINLEKVKPKGLTLRSPICPLCGTRERSRTLATGKLNTYCTECNRKRVKDN